MISENKQIVEKINKAFDTSDINAFLSYCAENVSWNIIGENKFTGKEAIKKFMDGRPQTPPHFTVKEIIAEENTAVCYGDMQMKDNEGVSEDYSFCDVYHFSGGKVNEFLTFMTKHKQKTN